MKKQSPFVLNRGQSKKKQNNVCTELLVQHLKRYPDPEILKEEADRFVAALRPERNRQDLRRNASKMKLMRTIYHGLQKRQVRSAVMEANENRQKEEEEE